MRHLIGKVTGANGKLVVHHAAQSDLPTVAEIHSSCFSRGWSDGEIEKLLAQDAYSCLVVSRQGSVPAKPVGFVVYKTVLDEAEIISIATQPKSRRRGVAKLLLDSVIRQLLSDRARLLFLEVDEQNKPAIELYRKLGFFEFAKREGYYGHLSGETNNRSSALVMQLDLG